MGMVTDHKPVLTLLALMDEMRGIHEPSMAHAWPSPAKPQSPKPMGA